MFISSLSAHEGARSVEDATKRTYEWNDRKKRFSQRQIAVAVDILSRKGWIALT